MRTVVCSRVTNGGAHEGLWSFPRPSSCVGLDSVLLSLDYVVLLASVYCLCEARDSCQNESSRHFLHGCSFVLDGTPYVYIDFSFIFFGALMFPKLPICASFLFLTSRSRHLLAHRRGPSLSLERSCQRCYRGIGTHCSSSFSSPTSGWLRNCGTAGSRRRRESLPIATSLSGPVEPIHTCTAGSTDLCVTFYPSVASRRAYFTTLPGSAYRPPNAGTSRVSPSGG
ncbi:hypothetical protein BJV78DRAFT_815491 [Lactifluus subvellereus]|nr:hypothetical protein BJV78DRAFT_815491 [Lactifluus subvellereus]